MAIEANFTWVDQIVFVGTLLVSLGIGLYYAFFNKQTTNADFLVGGRNVPLFPIAISLLASYMSAIAVLGLPAEVYTQGTIIWEMAFNKMIFLPIAAAIFLPIFYRLGLTSVYEYLEHRFQSRVVMWMASGTFILQIVLFMGVVIYAPSLAFNTFVGFPLWASMVLIGGLASIYTAIGGLRAVVWTDVFQMFIMILGVLAIIIQGSYNVGGFGNAFTIAKNHGRVKFLDFQINPFEMYTSLNVFFGQGFAWCSMYGCHQTQVQRYCSMSSLKSAVTALLINGPLLAIAISLCCMSGIVVFATYADCDPLAAGLIKSKDQIIPYFVMEHFSYLPGLSGLFIACIFSGSLSTISSGLNSLAAVTWEDFLKRTAYFGNMDGPKQLKCIKLLAFSYGGLSLGMAFVVSHMGGILKTTILVNGAVLGPLLGVFLLGIVLPFSNKYGAIFGMLVGHGVTMWIALGSLLHPPDRSSLPTSIEGCNNTLHPNNTHYGVYSHNFNSSSFSEASISANNISSSSLDVEWPKKLFGISTMLYCVVGTVITVVVGILVSLLTGITSPSSVESKYILSCYSKILLRSTEKLNKRASNDDACVPCDDIQMESFKPSQNDYSHGKSNGVERRTVGLDNNT